MLIYVREMGCLKRCIQRWKKLLKRLAPYVKPVSKVCFIMLCWIDIIQVTDSLPSLASHLFLWAGEHLSRCSPPSCIAFSVTPAWCFCSCFPGISNRTYNCVQLTSNVILLKAELNENSLVLFPVKRGDGYEQTCWWVKKLMFLWGFLLVLLDGFPRVKKDNFFQWSKPRKYPIVLLYLSRFTAPVSMVLNGRVKWSYLPLWIHLQCQSRHNIQPKLWSQ